MSEIVIDAIKDTYLMIPLLFLTYLFIVYFERKQMSELPLFVGLQKYGVIVGSLVGLLPQCGFSVIAATLYLQRSISLGTMVAVFIATSDEAIPILIANPSLYSDMFLILVLKIVVAILVGYGVDFIFKNKDKRKQVTQSNTHWHEASCETHGDASCSCHTKHSSLFVTALIKAGKIYFFLFLTTLVLNAVIAIIGEHHLQDVLLTNSALQPFIAALFGFIPNCAASVVLTQLYVSGSVSFASLFAGLVTNAGLGVVILLKEKHQRKLVARVLLILYGSAIVSALLLMIW